MTSTPTPKSPAATNTEENLCKQKDDVEIDGGHELEFHLDFSDPSDKTIFQTPDGTAFYFSWTTLAVMSSFFADLRSLPYTSPDDDLIIVPLPSATAPALAFVFGSIKATYRGRTALPLPDKYRPWNDILAISDAYDLPFATLALYNSAQAADASPFDLFALAVLCKDSEGIKKLSWPLLTHKMSDFRSSWAESVLKSKAPLAVAQLHLHYATWLEQLEKFGNGQFHKQYIRFGRKCGKPQTPCPNYEAWDGNFVAFVSRALVKVKNSMAASPASLLEVAKAPILTSAVTNVTIE